MSERMLRVLELGEGVAAAYAAKLLGDHGADVIKIEGPGGDALRGQGPMAARGDGGLFLALNQNKRGVCLDLEASEALAEFEALLGWADIVVHNLDRAAAVRLGLDPAGVAAAHPALVVLSITPFGIDGPYADYQATELILANAGGWANLCPATHTDEDMPPLKVFGDQCALMAAVAGATAALACVLDPASNGQGEHIDLSIQAYVASVLEVGVPAYSYRGDVAARYHERSLIPWRIFQAKDAPVFIVCVEQDQWERLVAFMGDPEWAALPMFADQPSRAENQDLVHAFVQEFVGQWEAQALYHAAQQHRICVAPVMDLAQLARNEHLRAREFFATCDGIEVMASAVLTEHGRAGIRRAAPRLGEHNDEIIGRLSGNESELATAPARLPLSGVRVLDMTWAWAGPFCTLNLAHLGAEVIRLESEVRPDLYRRLPVHAPGLAEGLNCSGMFNQWNQGKASIALDFSQPEAIAIIRELVARSDVVVQNFATGVMARLGLDYDALREIKPDIIFASVSGYGQSGPYKHYMGYGPAIPPLTGLSAATGYLDGEAEEVGLSMPDPTAGITAAYAVVSALVKRNATGQGDHLDVTLWESTAVLNAEGWMQYVLTGTQPERLGNRSPHMAPHGVFRCEGEDHWVAIACASDAHWRALARLIDPQLEDDARFKSLDARLRHQEELESIIAAWTCGRDRWAVTRDLQGLGVPAFPTLSTADVVEDPHLNARGFIERLEHPEVGVRAHTGIPWRLHRRSNGVRAPAPCLGADTDRLLRTLLGLTDAEIADLHAARVIS